MTHFEGPIEQKVSYAIRTYEIDAYLQLRFTSLIQLMHETAMANVLRLKLSLWDLMPQNITWVLMRQRTNINRLPKLGETIIIQTYPCGFEKFFTYRDYRVFDEGGNAIAHSTTTWLLMDLTTRKMTRIPAFILAYNTYVPPPSQCLERATHKLPKFGTVNDAQQYNIHWHDLDFNNHTSNVRYYEWLIGSMPPEVLSTQQLKAFDLNFRAESRLGEVVSAEIQELGSDEYLHRLIRVSDQKELAIGHSQWAKHALV